MNTNLWAKRNTGRIVIFVVLTSVCAVPAIADVKIVTEIKTTGLPGAPSSGQETPSGGNPPSTDQAVTTYYREKKARVEMQDGTVLIYDRAADKVYSMDSGHKTYRIFSFKKWQEQSSSLPGMPEGMADKMKMETNLNLKRGEETMTIADKPARRYVVTGSASLAPDFDGFGGPPGGGGGGFPGSGGSFPGGPPPGGGFPGGGPPSGGFPRGGKMELPSTQIEGEFWVSETLTKTVATLKGKTPLYPSYALTLANGPLMGAFQKLLAEKMEKWKGFPLSSRVTFRLKMPVMPQGEDTAQTPPDPITITTKVTSFSEETLEDSLFQLPAGYTRETE